MIPTATVRAVAAVKRFTRGETKADVCEFCAASLGEPHEHLLEPFARRLFCACQACACLFPERGSAKYLRLQSRMRRIPGMSVDDRTLRALEIPVRLAFIVPSHVHGRVFATYPNARGATESIVPNAAWSDLVKALPAGFVVEPDVEGLLIDHLGGRADCYVATVDVCQRVIGVLRNPRRASGVDLAGFLAKLAEGSR